MKKVLVIEDEAIVAMELKAHLTSFGFQVLGPVSSYDAALEEAALDPPDLVLADIRVAGKKTGLEAGADIRRRHGSTLIVLTAHSDPATKARAEAHGATAILAKPFRPRALRETLEAALRE